jgi:hypothetical protein
MVDWRDHGKEPRWTAANVTDAIVAIACGIVFILAVSQ